MLKGLAVAGVLCLCAPPGVAGAGTYQVVYSFQGGADGAYPAAGLVKDSKGNLYGLTPAGGIAEPSCLNQGDQLGCGTVFKISPDGEETVLYRFCSQANCSDGAVPLGSLLIDSNDDLYGTTSGGGNACGCGTIFSVSKHGTERVLYSFGNQSGDGWSPEAGLIGDEAGNFYGTTYGGGGGTSPGGTVFELNRRGKETVLHSFCYRDCSVADGYNPIAPLFLRQGILYGTTPYNNSDSQLGTVFELTLSGSETIIAAPYTEGGYANIIPPLGISGLIAGKSGDLYGTTLFGGDDPFGGVVFKVTPDGTLSTVYSFCSQSGCTDGQEPGAGLVRDNTGNFYGTTWVGGNNTICNNVYNGCGVVFKVTPDGTESVLHSFCSEQNCTDGSYPAAGLLSAGNGDFFGTTEGGGDPNACNPGYGCGVVFEVKE